MRIAFAAVVSMIALGFGLGPASAAPWRWQRPVAPWCAVYSIDRGDTQWDCRYPSLQACVPYIIAGTRGFCHPNPAFPVPAEPRHKPHWHR